MPSIESNTNESVVVTGSALSTSANHNANPVQIVTAKQINATGMTNLGDFLQRLPSIGSSGTTNSQTNGGGGASCTDIRNLGQSRVLVLIDGKRTSLNGASACVDLNTIPVQQIASIEILKDGGSELYGADAVSGVINIKLRHDLTTGNITIKGGVTGQGDNLTGQISGYKGWNFDHDKGNITVFGSYMSQGGVLQRNRSWAANAQTNNPTSSSGVLHGSSITGDGLFYGNNTGNAYSGNGSSGVTDYNGQRYQYGQAQSLENALQNSTMSVDAHYAVNRHFDFYMNSRYSHKTSNYYMAPEPIAGSPTTILLPANYPGNTTGEPLQVYKRMMEWGNRRFETALDTWTSMAGLKGDIVGDWKYDVSYTYGMSRETDQTEGAGNYLKLLQEWGLEPSNPGNLQDPNTTFTYNPNSCAGSAGCQQSSAFSTLSQQGAAYSNYTTINHSLYQLRDLNLRINNNHVAKMPWKNGGSFGLAMGMEHRGESLNYTPDPNVVSGNTLTNTQGITSGGFNVTEGYLEGRLELLRNAFLARDLTIDAQGRYSSYSTFGSTKNWKASINWAPTQDVSFRATLGTSFRQPNVYEMYGGQALSYETATDPCAQVSSYGTLSNAVQASCAKRGINTATFTQAGSGQVATTTGGNTKLRPETGRTYTFGAVLTPRWIKGFSTSVEFWHYTLQHMIGSLGTQYILDSCYTGADSGQCSYITRNSGGQLTNVNAIDENLGNMITSGIDWDLSYHLMVTTRDVFSIENNFQRLLSYKQQNTAGGPWYNYMGSLLYQNTAGETSGVPITRDYLTLSWQHGPLSVSYMVNYISGMRWNNGTANLQPVGTQRIKTPGMYLQDLSMTYNFHRWAFTGGIQNIANKKPPFVASATDNSDGGMYGSYYNGRYFFLQAGMNF
ncbi:TonB-dependent receptor protein [Acetobacter nitrogenifigens DSM 23921 = NBRC 105050]|uniref:TonB-dependent receptor n=1 Tax=Acetobacter nitrogenifigens DSM 23921 = NBRC 105050 TaxID=1120919 RepID=A0A511X7M3_9PROT|nr:TonB-dependent receptor protein [Acetobacter nitrogenifigens DSM 23921 = NBRC 105050]GEN58938.1 TonB-dependent receptor [Acetobacter nitrogenifigens DSM 23921 = NBRC 105050]